MTDDSNIVYRRQRMVQRGECMRQGRENRADWLLYRYIPCRRPGTTGDPRSSPTNKPRVAKNWLWCRGWDGQISIYFLHLIGNKRQESPLGNPSRLGPSLFLAEGTLVCYTAVRPKRIILVNYIDYGAQDSRLAKLCSLINVRGSHCNLKIGQCGIKLLFWYVLLWSLAGLSCLRLQMSISTKAS